MSRQKATPHNLTDAGRAAERAAVAGWQELAEALDTAAVRTRDIAGYARSRVSGLGQAPKRSGQARRRGGNALDRGVAARDEAYRRGIAARDALAGKAVAGNQAHPWRWVIVAAVAGIGAGAAVAQCGRMLIRSREQAQLEKIEQTVADATADLPTGGQVNSQPVTENGGTDSKNPATGATDNTGSGSQGAAGTPASGGAAR